MIILKNKTITYGLLILIIIWTSIYFITISGHSKTMDRFFTDIPKSIEQDDWPRAESLVIELDKTWNKVKYIVMLDYAEQDYDNLSETIIRLKAAIKTHSGDEAISEAMVCRGYWQNLVRFVPEP